MRIIYKIKSSWDFISSQILIYLRRRWNSKMAISIKNHEDRITALENRKGYYSETLLFGGKWNSLGAGDERISLTSSVRNYDKIRLITTNNDYTMSMCDFPVTDYLNRKSVSVDFDQGDSRLRYISDTVAEVSNGAPNYLYAVYGLKLYYNFSYNITREFYKVKFKLKHYLCSHLQNYVLNKGGVNILSISLNDHESRIVELEKKNTEIEYFRMENHNWVKKYKNGLIEQGGIVDAKGSQKGQTVTFMEPFSNERYTLVTTSNNGGWGQVSGGWNKTPTSFNTCSWQSANGGYPTILIGWIAIGI